MQHRAISVFFSLLKACTNGSSEFMSNVSMNIVGMLYNLQLLQYAGENGVAAYGVMMYVSMIFSAAFIGYSIGVAPVIGYHHGAQNDEELKGILRRSLRIIGGLGLGMVLAAISFLRTLVFQCAAVLFLPVVLGISGVWISIVVAEVMAVALGIFFLIQKRKKYHYF